MAGLSLSLVLVVTVVLVVATREEPYVAPRPGATAGGVRPAEAAAAVQRLVTAVQERDVASAASLGADPAASRRLAALVRNADRIGLADVDLRYVGELGGVVESGSGTGEWSAVVTSSWRIAGLDRRGASADVRLDFTATGEGVAISRIGGSGGVTPVWMSGPLSVVRRGGVLVMAAARAERYALLARRAVGVVRRVLPAWDGRLVVEVPRRATDVDAALAVERGTFRTVAGVTATADASGRSSAPVHVFLNPAQLRSLTPVGAQVVVSHEAVHVAVDAPTSSLPVWLSEGFADYVALRDVDLPLSTTAAQVLREVRRDGPPRRLPDDRDFDEGSQYFGAAYEAAWLACRLLADRIGEDGLVRLQRQADGAQGFPQVFRREAGRSLDTFTQEWRALLEDLAD